MSSRPVVCVAPPSAFPTLVSRLLDRDPLQTAGLVDGRPRPWPRRGRNREKVVADRSLLSLQLGVVRGRRHRGEL